MKTKKFFFLYLCLAVFFLNSCSSDDKEEALTGITLDQKTLTLEVGKSSILEATLQPSGIKETITWTSSDKAVATVTDGLVTGVAVGNVTITAKAGSFSATCTVTVKEAVNPYASLNGTEYYPIIMDGVTAAALGSKIKADFRPDEAIRFLYVWNETYTANPSPSGKNFFGQAESWVSLIVANVGWSGAGFNIKTAGNEAALASLKAITDNPDKYYLHIGIKSTDNTVHAIILGGQTDIKFAIGSTGFVDNGTTYPALANFDRDGAWHEIEIPMTTLKTMGLSYSSFGADPNIFAFLSGGVQGKTLDLDAVFIYKKP